MIRGYRGDVLETFVRGLVPQVRFVDNVEWQTNNILLSLRCARRFLDQPCLLSYSDIIFTPAVARAAVDVAGGDRARDRSRVPRRSTRAAPSTRSRRARSPT